MPLTSAYWPVAFASVVMVMLLCCTGNWVRIEGVVEVERWLVTPSGLRFRVQEPDVRPCCPGCQVRVTECGVAAYPRPFDRHMLSSRWFHPPDAALVPAHRSAEIREAPGR